MSLTLSPPLRGRVALAAAAVVCFPVNGCSFEPGDTSENSNNKRVSAAGVSFEVPTGWEEVGAETVAEDAAEGESRDELADSMGMTREQFDRVVANVDLYLFDDEPSGQGFADNVNVVQILGRIPNDQRLRRQFVQFGAEVHKISHEQTDLGDAAVVVFEAELFGRRVQGEGIYVDTLDGTVVVTVGASEAEAAAEIADQILDTLAEAS
jgi:hypothetical protein